MLDRQSRFRSIAARLSPPPLTVFLVCLFACDETQEVGEVPLAPAEATQPVESPQGPTDRRANTGPVAKEVPLQITVHEGDTLDPEDPTVLQIPVQKKHAAFVLAGAHELLQTATADAEQAAIIPLAQGLMDQIARAEIVVHARAISYPPPPDVDHKSVTFSNLTVLKGKPKPQWDYAFLAEPLTCGCPAPALDTEALIFLRKHKQEVRLSGQDAIYPFRGGILVGFPGLAITLDALMLAYAAGMEVGP